MATRRWLGTATAVAQVDTLTVGGTIEADDNFTVTLTGEDGDTQAITTVAGATVAATVAATIQAALAASTLSLFSLITWTVNGAGVIGTAKTAGKPFSCAATTTESGGGAADAQTFTRAATTANKGPNDWNVAQNWNDETVPVDADDVYIDEGSVDILYGLNQSSIDLASLHINHLYTGKIGGSAAAEYLRFGTITTLAIGEYFGTGTPQGSRRIKIDAGSNACAATVYNSASTAEESYQQPIRLKLNHASATLTVLKGKVSLCTGTAETGQIATLTMGFVSNVNQDADVIVGSGVTLATVTKTGGSLLLLCACTTLTQKGGSCTTSGSGAITTANIYAGQFYPGSTGTITTLNAYGGTIDCTRSPLARTVTTPNIWGGVTLSYDTTIVTMTNKPVPQEAIRMQTTRLYG